MTICNDPDPEANAGEPVDDGWDEQPFKGLAIIVSATEHPNLDDWVIERAAEESASSGLRLGNYVGREGVLGEQRPLDMCCHVFAATREEVDDGVDSGAQPGQPAG